MARYSKKAGDKVEKAMHEMHEGTLRSGRSGQKVTSRKQAIAIGLSEAREEGAKVPKKVAAKNETAKKTAKNAASKKSAAPKKSATKKSAVKKSAVKKSTTGKSTGTKSTAKKKTSE